MVTNFNSIIDTFDIASLEATKVILTPYKDILQEGQYDSDIVSLEEVLTNGKVTAIDCIQTLTDAEGTEYLVRFRVYLEDLQKWVSAFAKYGLKGSLRGLIGVRETVTIKHGRRYAYIEKRQLAAPIATAEVQDTAEHSQNESPPRKRSGGLLNSKRRPPSSQREHLIADNDKDDAEFDEFDDFDDFDEFDDFDDED